MPNETLKIDIETVTGQAKAIRKSVDRYKKFGNEPFKGEIETISKMNTDFLARFKTMLTNLNDGNEKLTKALEEIAALTQQSLNTFEKIDSESASQMGFTKGHKEGA